MTKLKSIELERLAPRSAPYPDGGGLYLAVRSPTARSWFFRYQMGGKDRWLGLGSLQDVSLKEARLARDAARLRTKGDRTTPGVDIVEERRAARASVTIEGARAGLPTFEKCADAYVEEHWAGWSRKHRAQWASSLKTYAYPTIGKLTIPEIRPSHIYALLEPHWISKRETIDRVRGRIETVIARHLDINDPDARNPAEMTKQLKEKLPRRPKRAVRHHNALLYTDMPAFVAQLGKSNATAAYALKFLILCAGRTNEVLNARWDEIDWEQKIWAIPASRMKAGEDHTVPLTDQAIVVLRHMQETRDSDLIFPNSAGSGPLSHMTMLAVLGRMGRRDFTVHGCRATFGTWGEECTDFPDAVREAALAHQYKSEVMAAYQRGSKLEKRRALMKDWADYILPPSKLRVVA
jgi:integrase